jgi:hypothetical protein
MILASSNPAFRTKSLATASVKAPSTEFRPSRRQMLLSSYWHKADMLNALTNVRFWGQSGHDANGPVMSATPSRTAMSAAIEGFTTARLLLVEVLTMSAENSTGSA